MKFSSHYNLKFIFNLIDILGVGGLEVESNITMTKRKNPLIFISFEKLFAVQFRLKHFLTKVAKISINSLFFYD